MWRTALPAKKKPGSDPYMKIAGHVEEADMQREELKAHLEANEAKVGQLVQEMRDENKRLSDKMDNFSEQIDVRLGQFDSKAGEIAAENRAFKSEIAAEDRAFKSEVKETLTEIKGEAEKSRTSAVWSARFSGALLTLIVLVVAILSLLAALNVI